MNRNALSKKFNRLSAFVAMIPLCIAAYIYFRGGVSISVLELIVPALGYALLLSCLMMLLSIFHQDRKYLGLQLGAVTHEAQKRHGEIEALCEISELAKDLPVDRLLMLILNKAMQVMTVRNGSVFVVDPVEPDGLRLVAAQPPLVIAGNGRGEKPRRHLFVESVIESGKTLRIQDIKNDPRTLKSNDPKYQSPSFISMPVYNNKKVVAVMNLANKEHGGLFTESDERTLTIMLAAIGAGIENINLKNIIQRQQTEIKDLTAMLKA